MTARGRNEEGAVRCWGSEREGAKLEVELDVDRAPALDVWRVRIRQDGTLIADTARTAGADHEGQVCRGSVMYPA